jgi:hypothetical protein
VSQCPSLQVKFEMESAFVRLRAPMFWSFIPISFPESSLHQCDG